MKTISNAFADIIDNSAGRFLTVSFITANGTMRVMNCRTGVTKALKGGTCTVDKTRYCIVYDMTAKGYRSINRNTIVGLACEHGRAVAY